MLTTLVRHIRPHLEEFGELTPVRTRLKAILADGNGAIHQRQALNHRNHLADVVETALRDTTRDIRPTPQPDLLSRRSA
jgi:hypothetical protein